MNWVKKLDIAHFSYQVLKFCVSISVLLLVHDMNLLLFHTGRYGPNESNRPSIKARCFIIVMLDQSKQLNHRNPP